MTPLLGGVSCRFKAKIHFRGGSFSRIGTSGTTFSKYYSTLPNKRVKSAELASKKCGLRDAKSADFRNQKVRTFSIRKWTHFLFENRTRFYSIFGSLFGTKIGSLFCSKNGPTFFKKPGHFFVQLWIDRWIHFRITEVSIFESTVFYFRITGFRFFYSRGSIFCSRDSIFCSRIRFFYSRESIFIDPGRNHFQSPDPGHFFSKIGPRFIFRATFYRFY
jgi:hypothetical protein